MKGKEAKKETKKEKKDDRIMKKVSDYQKEKSGKQDLTINGTPKK